MKDPLPSAGPEDYRRFFSEFGEVVAVTIVRDNGRMLGLLAQKHVAEQMERALAHLRSRASPP